MQWHTLVERHHDNSQPCPLCLEDKYFFLYVENVSVQAILLDLHLTGIDGLEVLRRLRATKPGASPGVAIFTADPFADEFVDEIHRLDAIVILKMFLEPEDIPILVAHLAA
jgi:CheY-like chemotaxis protein